MTVICKMPGCKWTYESLAKDAFEEHCEFIKHLDIDHKDEWKEVATNMLFEFR